jgi:hypothetical protein
MDGQRAAGAWYIAGMTTFVVGRRLIEVDVG